MRLFITTHTINGKNSIQKAIIAEVERWKGTLIEEGGTKADCIKHFKKVLDHYNRELSKCKSCQMSENDNSISFSTIMSDDTFAILTFNEVNHSYDGITRWKEKKGGQQ